MASPAHRMHRVGKCFSVSCLRKACLLRPETGLLAGRNRPLGTVKRPVLRAQTARFATLRQSSGCAGGTVLRKCFTLAALALMPAGWLRAGVRHCFPRTAGGAYGIRLVAKRFVKKSVLNTI